MNTKEKVGYVSVDSGMLMICDPAYIDSVWSKSEFTALDKYRSKDGKIYAYHRTRNPLTDREKEMLSDVEEVFSSYDQPLKSTGKKPNEHIHHEDGDWEEIPRSEYDDMVGEFSGAGAGMTTLEKEGCGNLRFGKGHDGAGFAFTTNGDGVYTIDVTKNEHGMITKVEIVVRNDE